MRPLDPAAVRALLAVAAGTDLEAIIVTAIGTGDASRGARRAPLVRYRSGNRAILGATIGQTAGRPLGDHRQYQDRGSTRSDVLPALVIAALRKHRVEQRKLHFALGLGNLGPDADVFDRFGQQWHPNHVSQRFSRLVRRAKLPTMRFHDLRHGFASLAFAAGVPPKVVSESLGHSGSAITSQTYVHLLDDLKRDKSDRHDAFLGGVFDSSPEAGSEAS